MVLFNFNLIYGSEEIENFECTPVRETDFWQEFCKEIKCHERVLKNISFGIDFKTLKLDSPKMFRNKFSFLRVCYKTIHPLRIIVL